MIDFSLPAYEPEQLGNRLLVSEESWDMLVEKILSDVGFSELCAGGCRSQRVRYRWSAWVANQTLAFLWLLNGNPESASYPPSPLVALGCGHCVRLGVAAQFGMTSSELHRLQALWDDNPVAVASTVSALHVRGITVIPAIWH